MSLCTFALQRRLKRCPHEEAGHRVKEKLESEHTQASSDSDAELSSSLPPPTLSKYLELEWFICATMEADGPTYGANELVQAPLRILYGLLLSNLVAFDRLLQLVTVVPFNIFKSCFLSGDASAISFLIEMAITFITCVVFSEDLWLEDLIRQQNVVKLYVLMGALWVFDLIAEWWSKVINHSLDHQSIPYSSRLAYTVVNVFLTLIKIFLLVAQIKIVIVSFAGGKIVIGQERTLGHFGLLSIMLQVHMIKDLSYCLSTKDHCLGPDKLMNMFGAAASLRLRVFIISAIGHLVMYQRGDSAWSSNLVYGWIFYLGLDGLFMIIAIATICAKTQTRSAVVLDTIFSKFQSNLISSNGRQALYQSTFEQISFALVITCYHQVQQLISLTTMNLAIAVACLIAAKFVSSTSLYLILIRKTCGTDAVDKGIGADKPKMH